MYITAAGTGILVVNSHKAANDLFDRRGYTYSDRPRWISMCLPASVTVVGVCLPDPFVNDQWQTSYSLLASCCRSPGSVKCEWLLSLLLGILP